MSPKITKKAIFLDRDGTLNEDLGYCFKIEDCMILPGVIEGLQLLKDDFIYFIITNQPGIGRGVYSIKEFQVFNDFLVNELKTHGIHVVDTYFCPHTDGCDCKKPSTKFVKEIETKFKIDLRQSWVMGDHPSDVVMGERAKCKTIYLLTGHGKRHLDELKLNGIKPTFIANNLLEAGRYIKNEIRYLK